MEIERLGPLALIKAYDGIKVQKIEITRRTVELQLSRDTYFQEIVGLGQFWGSVYWDYTPLGLTWGLTGD